MGYPGIVPWSPPSKVRGWQMTLRPWPPTAQRRGFLPHLHNTEAPTVSVRMWTGLPAQLLPLTAVSSPFEAGLPPGSMAFPTGLVWLCFLCSGTGQAHLV